MPSVDIPLSVRRAIGLIVVHCSATPSGEWLGGLAPWQAGYRTAPSIIDAWHATRGFRRASAARSAFNWRLASIGYHFVVDIDGKVWTGRHLDEIGAHVAGHNERSVGICLVGGKEREGRYTAEQWRSLAELVVELRRQVGSVGIVGHRDLSPDANRNGVVEPREWLKTCPGFDVSEWVRAGMAPLADHLVV